MSSDWRLLLTSAGPGAWNMAVDEAILEHVGRGDAPSTLRLYAWDPACLSLGRAQSYADVDISRLQERGWEVVRRLTGGRAILHTDELTYSVVASAREQLMEGSVLESYNRLSGALLEAVRTLGLDAEMNVGGKAAPDLPNPICFEVPSAYEITVRGQKLIGSAQARRKAGVLQHGSFPLTGDLARIADALIFPDDVARRDAARRLTARATTAESILGHPVTWDVAAAAFVKAFETKLGLCFQRRPISDSESQRASALVREKYDHPSWTRRV